METSKVLTKEEVREVIEEEIAPLLKEILECVTKSPVGKMYTTGQTLSILKCCRSSLYRWEAEGRLVPTKQGGRNMYRYEDIERFINNDNF